jgi:organic radical activating enzyme
MEKAGVPERYNYIAAFLTLRCNLNCSYCINNNSGVSRKRLELDAEQWVNGLNRLAMRKDLPITIEGGEPTLHSGFYNILEKVKHPVDLLTNLQFDVEEFISKVDPNWLNKRDIPSYKTIRISFHPEGMNLEDTIKKAVKLQDAGFDIGIFSLNLPEAIEDNMKMAEIARQNQIYFFIKDFLGWRNGKLFGHYRYPEALDGNLKKAECRIKELLISPAGKIYRCHRDLYHEEMPIGDILEENFEIKDIFRTCSNYGTCNPCDIKLKTNRFLKMGSCSVEIKPIE